MRFDPLAPQTLIFPDYEHIPFILYPTYKYRYDYKKLWVKVADPNVSASERHKWYRQMILHDLFFIIYFHLKIKKANHPWVIERCNEVQEDIDNKRDIDLLDLWAREHFKSTILTTAKPIQKILRNPEERICIFSFKMEAARKFYDPIKVLFESDALLIKLFPEILSDDLREYPLWTRDLGFTVKREGFYREPTLMWSALSSGMPTGMHFTGKIYDDIMTADMAESPVDIARSKMMFDMSQNLRDSEMESHHLNPNKEKDKSVEWQVIAGTPYHFDDVLTHIENLRNLDNTPSYKVRRYPATDDGSANGKPVLLTQAALDRLKRDRRSFASQQLLNPMPPSDRVLRWDLMVKVSKDQLPSNLWKFLLVDPAGTTESNKTKGDKWAIALLGIDPYRDDYGASSVYILKLYIRRFSFAEAMSRIVETYIYSGRIVKLAVEKVATSTYEIHIANALKQFGRHLTVKNKGLVLLRPGHRNKHERIESSLSWPILNGKVHYLDSIDGSDIDALRTEMQQFPLGGDDGLDILSYYVDVIKDYKFPRSESSVAAIEKSTNDLYLEEDIPSHMNANIRSWMVG